MAAVDLVLLLPDRHAVLDRLDDVAAQGDREVAVRARDEHDEGEVADLEVADAVLAMTSPATATEIDSHVAADSGPSRSAPTESVR